MRINITRHETFEAHRKITQQAVGVKIVQPEIRSSPSLLSYPDLLFAMAAPGQPLPLQVVEQVLNFIRGNLYNIESSWGIDSPQYRSAFQLMNDWMDDNFKQLNLGQSDLDELMQKMSLHEPKP